MNSPIARVLGVALTVLPIACAAGTEPGDNGNNSTIPPMPTVSQYKAGTNAVSIGGAAQGAVDEFELRMNVRAVWVDEAQWMRSYIVAALAPTQGSSISEITEHRLVLSEASAAESLSLFVAPADESKVMQLLAEHATGLRNVVAAGPGVGRSGVPSPRLAWLANGDAIAHALVDANPKWNFQDLETPLHDELTHAIAIVDARAASNWSADASEWAAMRDSANAFADVIAKGLSDGFPQHVVATAVSSQEQALRLSVRPVLEDTAYWTRQAMVSHALGLADEQTAIDQLTGTTSALLPVLQATIGDAATAVRDAFLVVSADSVDYLRATDDGTRDEIRARWFADAENAAVVLANADALSPNLGAFGKQLGIRAAATWWEMDAIRAGDLATELQRYGTVLGANRTLADLVAKAGSH